MLWHYTTGRKLKQISADGEIRPATARVPEGERPVVWFSYHPEWEPTASKIFRAGDGSMRAATIEEMEWLARGLARIGISPDTAPYKWYQLKRLSGMKGGDAKLLERAAAEIRSRTDDWRGTFAPVPRSKWLTIEINRIRGTWIRLE